MYASPHYYELQQPKAYITGPKLKYNETSSMITIKSYLIAVLDRDACFPRSFLYTYNKDR